MIGGVTPLLDARDIRKSYGGAVALRGASLSVAPGEIHALLGENGAGKSTLIKCIAGTPPPDSGTITVDGRPLPLRHGPQAAAAAGLAFIHQESTLIEDLSVEENIAFVEGYPRRLGLIDWSAVRRRAQEALDALQLSIDPRAKIAELPIASRTTVAIARALALSAKLLVLDEPTASLGAKDVAALFAALRRIAARGEAIVFVSHRLDEVFDLCDRVTVLRDGANVASVRPQDISRHELITMICGREVNLARRPSAAARSTPLIEAKGLEGEVVAPIDFSVAPGEIVGFTGLSDAGHYDLGEMLFGLAPIIQGQATLNGKPFRPHSPAAAIAAGIGYVPRDRNVDGLARNMTLTENLFFNPDKNAPGIAGSLLVSATRQEAAARTLLKQFTVRPPIPDAFIATLSGGNAQKVLLARSLSTQARLLIINDVSVGVDVGAREDIYAAIRQSAAAGAAVMILTSDFEEIENLCARAFVLVRGVLRAELRGESLTVAAMSGALAGTSTAAPHISKPGSAA